MNKEVEIIIYSDDPKIEPTILKVDLGIDNGSYIQNSVFINTTSPQYIHIDNKDLFKTLFSYSFFIYRRWPEAEEYIKRDPEWAYNYSRYIIKGRWPEAEEIIIKKPEWAYNYVFNIIKGRWLEAEETIKQDSFYAFHYALNIMKERWSEAEEI